jgi:hypothetical protein
MGTAQLRDGQPGFRSSLSQQSLTYTTGETVVNDGRTPCRPRRHREFWGAEAIRRWVAKEMVGDHVTIEVTEVLDHHGQMIIRGRYDGDFDKTNLPDELILTNYFTIRDNKIESLFVIRNTPADL